MQFKIMTFNIMHGINYRLLKEGIRKVELDKVANIITNENPDIFSINEIYGKGFKENDPEFFDHVTELAKLTNYPYFYFSKAIDAPCGEYGNAIFSKYPFSEVIKFEIPDPIKEEGKTRYESRVITRATFELNGKKLDVIGSHFGLVDTEKENAYNTLIKVLRNNPSVFLGDLNMEPNHEIIKKIFKIFNEATIDKYGEVLLTHKTIDPFNKIDYVFYKDLGLIDSYVVNKVQSDHFPVIGVFEI